MVCSLTCSLNKVKNLGLCYKIQEFFDQTCRSVRVFERPFEAWKDQVGNFHGEHCPHFSTTLKQHLFMGTQSSPKNCVPLPTISQLFLTCRMLVCRLSFVFLLNSYIPKFGMYFVSITTCKSCFGNKPTTDLAVEDVSHLGPHKY